MAATIPDFLTRDKKADQIERIVRSPVLRGSDSLCQLLRFLSRYSLDHPDASIKEYLIATELFGRPDFDPRLDSSVRVQTGRLRAKLGEYYAGPGAHDPIMVGIPKGSYRLTFDRRESDGEQNEAIPPPSPAAPSRKWRWILAGLGLAATVLLLAAAFLRENASQPAPPLRAFWEGFLADAEPPLVVFSNAEFVGRPESGLRYFRQSTDSAEPIIDHYTGIGEVIAIHELDRLFFRFERTVRVKRGRLLTWDEAKQSNLIFIGSPSENLSVRELSVPLNFVFRVLDQPPRAGDLAIVNLRPADGEPAAFLASPVVPINEDYAVIQLLEGTNDRHWILLLAGITTQGTHAAAEFVCQPSQVNQLLSRLKVPAEGPIVPFEAVLRVRINGGVPVQSTIVAVRRRAK